MKAEQSEDYILTAHRSNLVPEALASRKAFDDRFASYCSEIFRAFSTKINGRPRVLSLGCGLGLDVMAFTALGYDSRGMELADMTDTWRELHGQRTSQLAVSPSGSIPFGDEKFDLIVSFNVLEHVGTIPPKEIVTSSTLSARHAYISQAIDRLTKNGVFLLIAPNKAFPLDYGHNHWYGGWKYVNAKGHGKRGWSLTNPFGKSNFLPSLSDIRTICREINRNQKIQLHFLDDYSLAGFQQHKAMARHINSAWSRACALVKGQKYGFYVNPAIQAVIIKGGGESPKLNDFCIQDPYGSAIWKRRGFSSTYNAEWKLRDSKSCHVDIFTCSSENKSDLTFSSVVSGTVYRGHLDSSGQIEGELVQNDGQVLRWCGHSVNDRLWSISL